MLIPFALLFACGPSGDSAEGPTWHSDVSPALQGQCTRCHAPGGQGAGDFTTPEAVAALAPAMIEAIQSGRMPPPVSDPDCQDYLGSEHLAPDPTLATLLQTWIDAGAPEGDPALAPVVEPVTEQLTDPDVVVTMTAPYTPTYQSARDPGNEYRCFVMEHGQTEDFYLRRMAPVIDQRSIVHHALLFTVADDDVPDHDVAMGWDCIDDAFVGGDGYESVLSGYGMVGAWGPGAVPVELTDGYGFRVTPEMKLVIQIHYYQSDDTDGVADQSGWAFEVWDEPVLPVLIGPFGVFDFRIPAGDANYTADTSIQLPLPITIHGVFPHMHVLGTSYSAEVTAPDGEVTCLTRSDRWDFHNQLTYTYREPVEVESDSVVSLRCSWDNSAENPNQLNDEPKEVRYGERTDEEMCYAFSYVSLGN